MSKQKKIKSVGIHEVKIRKTASYIVRNGRCDYKVIIPDDCDDTVKKAAEELVFFFREATGITLPIYPEKEAKLYRPEYLYFSVGKTKMIERSRIFESTIYENDPSLGRNGARVMTHGHSVFMFGDGSRGTLNAVYEFLQAVLHYDFYFTNVYTIDRNVKDLAYYELDIKEVPDIHFHTSGYGYMKDDTRLRLRRSGDCIMSVGGCTGHNSMQWVDAENTRATHPAWFSEPKGQLCYTARGDEKEFKAMVDQCVETLKKEMIAQPTKDVVRFCMQDNEEVCNCPACEEKFKKYGTRVAAPIILFNNIKRRIDAWMKTDEGKPYARNLKLTFYAYVSLEVPPAKIDEKTGEYVAIDDEVKCVDGIAPMLTFIEMKYTRSLQDPINKEFAEYFRGWKAIAKEFHFYYYDTNYHYFLAPYESISNMREYYELAVDRQAYLLHNLGQHINDHPTGFSTLKGYLHSKLAWNINVDFDACIDKFFNGYFGPAAKTMRELFDSYMKVAYVQPRELGYGERRNCDVYANPIDKKYWNKAQLEEWLALTDKAIEDIKPLINTNYQDFDIYMRNIIAERIFIKYLLIEVFGDEYPEEQVLTWKYSVKHDAAYIGLQNAQEGRESSRMEAKYVQWGIA